MNENNCFASFVGLSGIPISLWCSGVVGPKSFAAAQRVLNTCCKTAVKTADTAYLQIGGLCWYLSEGTFGTTFGITFGLYQVYWLLSTVFTSLGKVNIRFKFRDISYPPFVID